MLCALTPACYVYYASTLACARRELTREPVVLHWKGSSGTGPRDIQLKGAVMEIAGKQLLKAHYIVHYLVHYLVHYITSVMEIAG